MPVSSDLKKFSKAFIIILVCIVLADFVIGSALAHLYKIQSSGLLYRANYAKNVTTADYLVFGSSRANHHYDPKVFEQELNKSFYNCGRDAQGIIYTCAFTSSVINRYKPKGIIIDVRPNEFTITDKGTIASLLPYKDDKLVSRYFEYNGPYENIKTLSHIYPYNSLLTNLLVGITSFNKKRTEDYKGYQALKSVSKSKTLTEFAEHNEVDTAKVTYFKQLLTQLDKENIPTLVVISPLNYEYIDGPTVEILKKECAGFKSIQFLNYAHDPLCKNPLNFSDKYHLNDKGAAIFSEMIVAKMRSL